MWRQQGLTQQQSPVLSNLSMWPGLHAVLRLYRTQQMQLCTRSFSLNPSGQTFPSVPSLQTLRLSTLIKGQGGLCHQSLMT